MDAEDMENFPINVEETDNMSDITEKGPETQDIDEMDAMLCNQPHCADQTTQSQENENVKRCRVLQTRSNMLSSIPGNECFIAVTGDEMTGEMNAWENDVVCMMTSVNDGCRLSSCMH